MNATRMTLAVLALCIGLAAPALAAAPESVEPASDSASAPLSEPASQAASEPEIAETDPALAAEEAALQQEPLPMSTGITCTFNCNDGFGFLYQCPHPTLNQCCQQAQPACSAHGGLESGICRKGRLGLPCTPI